MRMPFELESRRNSTPRGAGVGGGRAITGLGSGGLFRGVDAERFDVFGNFGR